MGLECSRELWEAVWRVFQSSQEKGKRSGADVHPSAIGEGLLIRGLMARGTSGEQIDVEPLRLCYSYLFLSANYEQVLLF